MATPDPELSAQLVPSIAAVDAAAWDRLAGTDDPFVAHAFLALLERSGSVGAGTGWSPLHLLVESGGKLIGAAPAYLKAHSQGEYVFDQGWAEAFARAGGDYYPKLQLSVPFTPCPGPRLLGDRAALIAGLEAAVVQNGLSGAHATFLEEADRTAFEARGWLVREGVQYHWHNRGYAVFDDFLAALSSGRRKNIRKERARSLERLEVETLRGTQITPEAVEAMWRFYQDTGRRKWGYPYLTRGFFDGMVDALGDALLLFLAREEGVPVAGALNLVGGDVLYGRYWGTAIDRPGLHFELSYYRAIEWAITHAIGVVQAGAQGEHKLLRGYEPVRTYSAHFLPDPGFRAAVADFLAREREAVAQEMAWGEAALPYRRG
ncbi:GNAT family N-acetyltransferase [Sphingomicrobium astaxanthinifaciens]|uniref:GNAT family N-acetyltransferase n=1 Tax=Sphingomicrobium astaxanthinifaciens TaxID=1227949 RepID=UPI001FCB7A57|nr:GNAT family N-acetyltransferase [Sphingomicrobium astaxanthinifaciens]MCJ7421100.1 GNAT family N-acetyltransferase [Sphingomicrobium astaxanthinifaciens]